MEGISKNELIRLKENMPDNNSKLFIHALIVHCKELPDQQWQSIDEFKANPVDGLCFAMYRNCVCNLNFWNGRFEYEGMYYSENYITHVMPIKKPEAPK